MSGPVKYEIELNEFTEPRYVLRPHPHHIAMEEDWPADDGAAHRAPTSRGEILRAADRLVTGDREAQYGDPHEFWKIVAGMWEARLRVPISAATACSMMANVKQVRAQLGAPNPDNAVDACGYEALAGEISLRGER